jgi:hypothetical protein
MGFRTSCAVDNKKRKVVSLLEKVEMLDKLDKGIRIGTIK